MAKKLNWGIIGAGKIAHRFAEGLADAQHGRLMAIGSRSQEKADAFAAKYAARPKAYGSYEALLADPEIEAVYIATPHRHHTPWVIKAAQAGKHILCEKPFAINHAEAVAALEVVRKHNVFLMEAFMYRCHPQTLSLVEMLQHHVIGEIRMIRASFGYNEPFDPANPLHEQVYGHDSAGGAILDVGCYPVSMARLIAGVARGKAFENPLELKGVGVLGPTRVDHYALASAKFPGDIIAELGTAVSLQLENHVRIVGTQGIILIPTPWQPAPKGGFSKIIIFKNGIPEEVVVDVQKNLYTYEADHVAEQIAQGRTQSPLVSWEDTLGNIAALDQWRASIGLRYEWE